MMAAETTPRVLLEGISFPESPRWHDGRLWFSDWMAHQVIALDESGASEAIADVEAFPFSIDWLPDGPMLITAGRELLRLDPGGSLARHMDLSELSQYGLNEIVVDGRGYTYVNGAGFDMMAGEEPKPGMIVLVTPENGPRRVAEEIAFPNGMAITVDGSTLIVADSYGKELTAFDVGGDGSLTNRRVWADLGDGTPDGICIDAEGAVWYADVPNRRCVRVAQGGEVLQTVELDRGCFACMLGGIDGNTLFIAAQEWTGPERIGTGPRTGQIAVVEAPAPHAGYP
jgi:sugar lactone lactonase YvrE